MEKRSSGNGLHKASLTLIGIPLLCLFARNAKAEPVQNLPYAQYTAQWEGRRGRVYDPNPNDGRDEPTIGVGHNMAREDSQATFRRVLPNANHNSVRRGRETLTNNQIDSLFANDIQTYIDRTRARINNFDALPEYLRTALVDATYRGDLGPRTIRLINENNWTAAAREYLNHRQYQNAVALRIPGIRPRMESNRDAMLRYAGESRQ